MEMINKSTCYQKKKKNEIMTVNAVSQVRLLLFEQFPTLCPPEKTSLILPFYVEIQCFFLTEDNKNNGN